MMKSNHGYKNSWGQCTTFLVNLMETGKVNVMEASIVSVWVLECLGYGPVGRNKATVINVIPEKYIES